METGMFVKLEPKTNALSVFIVVMDHNPDEFSKHH